MGSGRVSPRPERRLLRFGCLLSLNRAVKGEARVKRRPGNEGARRTLMASIAYSTALLLLLRDHIEGPIATYLGITGPLARKC